MTGEWVHSLFLAMEEGNERSVQKVNAAKLLLQFQYYPGLKKLSHRTINWNCITESQATVFLRRMIWYSNYFTGGGKN
jgi:hypothetical protein